MLLLPLKICLTFDQFILFIKDIKGLTADYGEYFSLTVDLYFDPWTEIEVHSIVECHPIV